jgi:hypothetical protein
MARQALSFRLLHQLFFSTLLVGFISNSAIAQDDEDEFVFPTAQEVIDKYIQALGGYEVLASRENVHYISNGHSSHGSVFTYEVYQAEGKFCSRFDYQDGRILERGIRTNRQHNDDGTRKGFAWETTNGVFREMIADERQEYLRRRSSVTSVTRLFDYYKSIEFDSTDAIDGREVNALILTDHNGKKVKRYYDVETGLLRRQECEEAFSHKNIHVVRDYYDYEQVGEYMISKKQVVTQSDNSVWTYEIELYEVNTKVPRETFAIPKPMALSIAKVTAEEKAKAAEKLAAAEKADLGEPSSPIGEAPETIEQTETANIDK